MPTVRNIIRRKKIEAATGLSTAQITRKANDPEDEFPAPVQTGANSVGWFEDEVIEWQESRPRVTGERKSHLEAHYGRGAKNAPQASETAAEPAPETA